MIPDSFIEELKSRCDIETIASSYVHLNRRGKVLTGLCPFHNEKSPSFTVYPDNQSFYCFGCGAGGTVIHFIERAENLEFVEAVKFLAERAGLRVPEEGREDPAARQKQRILEMNREAARFYNKLLRSPAGQPGYRYFQERMLSDATITRFGLGYAPDSWDMLSRHLKELGYSEQEMIGAKLASRGKKGNNCFDMFRNRVMFPILDLRGGVIGFGGRVLGPGEPKYLNTPDTPVFKKSRNLYALWRAKNSKNEGMILCEGYMDVIALHQAGFDNAVATLGTALTSEQTHLISRYCGKETFLCYDSDGPGQKAARRALELFSEAGVRVRVIRMDGAKDPDEYLKKFGAARFRLLLQNCSNAVEFELASIRGKYDLTSPDGKVGFLNECAVLLAGIRNPVERDVYLQRVASETEVSPAALLEAVNAVVRRNRSKEARREKQDLKMYVGAGGSARQNPDRNRNLRGALAEERLLTLLLKNPDFYDYIAAKVQPGDFVTPYNQRLYEVLSGRLRNRQSIDLLPLSGVLEPEAMSYLAELLAKDIQERHTAGEADEYIRTLQSCKIQKSDREVAGMEDRQWAEYVNQLAAGKNRGK